MIAILIAMSFLALYANVQKLRRAKIEEVQVTTPHAHPLPHPKRGENASPEGGDFGLYFE